ncbi:methyltransferase domain-containing protein [Carboxylicivirga sp. A043]|uniref:class I SAM-dependent methyltransferase n=1 Tax=Carboxylicivirga litoralis TaxID=2816963 RepID=UPI0021CB01E8|nr:class I SAM-dependent methyltransferase [Carboxylicivirga sp. A043]MCU4154376.1 methyltransferase domain-containing protein [Carboxylicivirga sp. A043]
MSVTYGKDTKSALQAKFDAQKIAFAPIMFQAALALRNLGILELIKSKRKGITIEAIAEELNLSVYGVKVLLEAGLSLEMVMVENDVYKITKTGWYILSDELTRVNMDFTQDVNYKGMFTLEDSIKEGKPTGLKEFGDWPTVYEGLAHLPEKAKESWFAFDHYYSDYAFPEIMPIVFRNNPKRILDVGGNTGKFSIQCAKYNEDVKVTILDLPGQLNVAKQNIEKNGFSDRVDGHPINLLDHSNAFPQGADIVWMSQFLDCFSQEDILELLKRSNNAIDENGRVYILETYWDNQEFEASTYSLHATSLYFTNIANGCSQMYHTEDMLALVEKAGLEVEETVENIGVSHTLLICKKK